MVNKKNVLNNLQFIFVLEKFIFKKLVKQMFKF